MKKLLFIPLAIFISVSLLGQTTGDFPSKKDTLFLAGKKIGYIDSKNSIDNPLGKNYNIVLTVPLTRAQKRLIEAEVESAERKLMLIEDSIASIARKGKSPDTLIVGSYYGPSGKPYYPPTFIYTEKFTCSPTQYGGYYLEKSGRLKNAKNTVSLIGSVLGTGLTFVNPLIGGGVVFVTSVTAIVLDYRANNMIIKASGKLIEN